jgi:L-threonylcarbamoyladenylate synthase
MSQSQTSIRPAALETSLNEAVHVLRSGGLVAFPTDTVYGLGALAFHEHAAEALYIVKERPEERAIPVLLGDAASLSAVAVGVSKNARALAARFWPGPLTLVLLKHPDVPRAVSPYKTVAVRVPDHPVAHALLVAAGPLAVTSANLAGRPPTRNAEEVADQLRGRIGLILDGGIAPGGQPSTIVDCTKAELVILRPGPLTLEDLRSALS